MLRREAAEGIRPVAGDRLLAPNEYIITLGMHDYQKVGADPDLTSDAFAKHLARYIGEQGWQTYGDVVIRFEQSANLHTGQFRTRGAVNPDVEPRPTAGELAPPQSDHAFSAEPGVPAMSENSSYGGGQGQGRPGDDYYDDPYAHPHDDPHAAPDPRAGHQPEPGGYPDQRGGYPDQGGYPRAVRAAPRGGYPDQRGYGHPTSAAATPTSAAATPSSAAATPTRAATPTAARRLPGRRLRRSPTRAAGISRNLAATPSSAAATPNSGGYGAPDHARRLPRPGRLPRPARRLPRTGRRLRPGPRAAADTAGRTTASSPTTADRTTASHTPRPVAAAGTPSPGATTTTASPRTPAVTAAATDNRAATRPRARRSRCNSTTAVGAPISYVKARTSLAAARMHSSGCRTPVCRVATWRFGGTAKSRCCPTSIPPTAPPSTTRLFRSGSWPTAM